MAAKKSKKKAAKKPVKRAAAPKAARAKKPAASRPTAKKTAGRGGDGEVVYSDVLHELRMGLVGRLIR